MRLEPAYWDEGKTAARSLKTPQHVRQRNFSVLAFDYLVVNDSFDLALSQLTTSSAAAEHLRRDVQEMAQGELLTELLTEAR